MSPGHKKFLIISTLIILIDCIHQVLGWISIIGLYIYKTPGCTYYFYSHQCCPSINYYDLTCSDATSIQYQFIAAIVSQSTIYVLFIGLYLSCLHFCPEKKQLSLQCSWILMIICTLGCKTLFFMVQSEISMIANPDDNGLFNISGVCIGFVMLGFVKFFLLLGISCCVNFSQEYQQQQQATTTQNQQSIVMQTIMLAAHESPINEQQTQRQYNQIQQQLNHQQNTDGSIVLEELEFGKKINKPLVHELDYQQPIILQPVEGLPLKK